MTARSYRRMCLPLLALSASCWHPAAPVRAPLRIVRTTPELGESAPRLLLNEPITVYFSAPVDPLHVTSDTVAVLDAEGHPVRGSLLPDPRDGRWVTFTPRPPLTASYDDGSLQPDSVYRLVVVGNPRPDGVRAVTGERLEEGLIRSFRTAAIDSSEVGLPGPLRPVNNSLPFVTNMVPGKVTPLSAADPRLLLHFTLPVLPTSIGVDALEITLLRDARPRGHLVPQRMRLLPQLPIDPHPGCTLEVDLGPEVVLRDGVTEERLALLPGDGVAVKLRSGERGLLDYAGRSLPPSPPCWWLMVQSVAVAEWPSPRVRRIFGEDLQVPGFEVVGAAETTLQPLVRVEAGDGSLGMFRPQHDLTLRVGEPFDRGDGVLVQSRGRQFPFGGIDIPAGVRVTVDARGGPVQLLAVGRARIGGTLAVAGESQLLDLRPGVTAHISTVFDSCAVALLAAGGIEVVGAIEAVGAQSPAGVPVALVTSGQLGLTGEIPQGAILATEVPGPQAGMGAVGRNPIPLRVELTPGLPVGVELQAIGYTAYRPLSYRRAGGVLQFERCDEGIQLAWQAAAPDALQPDLPDRDPARSAPPRRIGNGERIDAGAGEFIRLRVQAVLRGGEALPQVRRLQILDM